MLPEPLHRQIIPTALSSTTYSYLVETVESDKHVINHFKVGTCTQGTTKAIGTCTHLWKHSYIIEKEAVDVNLIKEDKNF